MAHHGATSAGSIHRRAGLKADTIAYMISRLNFLLAVSMLTVLLFYFAGRFVFLKALLAVAPASAPYFTAAYGLAALMLTVLVLAKTVIRLGSVSTAARTSEAGLRLLAAQAILCLGHVLVIFALYTRFVAQDGDPVSWPYFLAALLYAAGIAAAIFDMRNRALQAQ